MVKLDLFWLTNKSYLTFSRETGFVLKPDAPKEYWDSYHHYLEQEEYYRKLEYDESGNRVRCII